MSSKRVKKPKRKTRGVRNRKKDRLIRLARRAGIMGGLVVFVLWLGTWAWLSGTVHRTVYSTTQSFYNFTAAQGFAVHNIYVQGRENTDEDVLRALLNLERGDPILAFSPSGARKLLERITWVKRAHVERRLPDTVYIHLVERRPMALWQHKGKIRVVDHEAVTIGASKPEQFKDLILLVGEDAPQEAIQLIKLLEAEPSIKERVEAAIWVGERRWDLRLKNGMQVKLPAEDMGFALRRLAAEQERERLFDKNLTVIDAREPDRLTVRTVPGAVKEYKASVKKNI